MTHKERHPFWLEDDLLFPEVEQALEDPNGLLAMGGDLSQERLMLAYSKGIFPWYSNPDPIIWWSPDPRAVLFLDDLKVSRSLNKSIRNRHYEVWLNKDFTQVISHCADKRKYANGTWITDDMQAAYTDMYNSGLAHCISVYSNQKMVGGLYGLSQGKFFFGESMFSSSTDASKVALYFLVEHLKAHDFLMIDCQVPNPHLQSLGSINLERKDFIKLLTKNVDAPQSVLMWQQRCLTNTTQ